MSGSLRVAYDARLSLGRYRGMGQFLRMLIAGHEREFLGFCAAGEQDSSLRLVASGHRFYPLWEQVSLPKWIDRERVDLFLAPYNTAPLRLPAHVVLVLVVHDFIYFEPLPLSRSIYQNFGRLYRRAIVPRALQRADVIVTVSHYTEEQMVRHWGVARQKIQVIPNSLEAQWFTPTPMPRIAGGYIFMVSGEAPSKNLARAIAAYARYRELCGEPSLLLKIAGVKVQFHSGFRALAKRVGVADHIEFLEYLPPDQMRHLYSNAALFVLPSLVEGFGIPVLEAMASGTPVVASRSASLLEVGGAAARYFDPHSIEDIAKTMRDVLANPALLLEMSELGRHQVRGFHPDIVSETVRRFWHSRLGRASESAIDSIPVVP